MSDHSDWMRHVRPILYSRGRARVLVLGLALALLPTTGSVVEAQAHARIDQAQTAVQGGLSVRASAWQRVRMGRTGWVTRVDVPLCAARRGSAVILTLRDEVADRGVPASASRTFRRSLVDCAWYSFRLRRFLRVRRGDVMRLTVARWHGVAPLWGASLHGRNPYRRGSGHWIGHTIEDFAFRIYVILQ